MLHGATLFQCMNVSYAKAKFDASKHPKYVCSYAEVCFPTASNDISIHYVSSLVNQGKVSENLDVFDVMRRHGWYVNEITRSIIAYGLCTKSYTDQNCALFLSEIWEIVCWEYISLQWSPKLRVSLDVAMLLWHMHLRKKKKSRYPCVWRTYIHMQQGFMVDVCKKRLMKLGTSSSWKCKRRVFNWLWFDYFGSFGNKTNIETLVTCLRKS